MGESKDTEGDMCEQRNGPIRRLASGSAISIADICNSDLENSDSYIRIQRYDKKKEISSEPEYALRINHNKPKTRNDAHVETRRSVSQSNKKVACVKSTRPTGSQKDDDGTIGFRVIRPHLDPENLPNTVQQNNEDTRQWYTQGKTSKAGVLSRIENGRFDALVLDHQTERIDRLNKDSSFSSKFSCDTRSGIFRRFQESKKKGNVRSDSRVGSNYRPHFNHKYGTLSRKETIKIRANIGTKTSELKKKSQVVGDLPSNHNVTKKYEKVIHRDNLGDQKESETIHQGVYSRMLKDTKLLDGLQKELTEQIGDKDEIHMSYSNSYNENDSRDVDQWETNYSKEISCALSESHRKISDIETIEGLQRLYEFHDSILSNLKEDNLRRSGKLKNSCNGSAQRVQNMDYPRTKEIPNESSDTVCDSTESDVDSSVDSIIKSGFIGQSPYSFHCSVQLKNRNEEEYKITADKRDKMASTTFFDTHQNKLIYINTRKDVASSSTKQHNKQANIQTELNDMYPSNMGYRNKKSANTVMSEESKRLFTLANRIDNSRRLRSTGTDTIKAEDERMERLIRLTKGLTAFINKKKNPKLWEKIPPKETEDLIVSALHYLSESKNSPLGIVQPEVQSKPQPVEERRGVHDSSITAFPEMDDFDIQCKINESLYIFENRTKMRSGKLKSKSISNVEKMYSGNVVGKEDLQDTTASVQSESVKGERGHLEDPRIYEKLDTVVDGVEDVNRNISSSKVISKTLMPHNNTLSVVSDTISLVRTPIQSTTAYQIKRSNRNLSLGGDETSNPSPCLLSAAKDFVSGFKNHQTGSATKSKLFNNFNRSTLVQDLQESVTPKINYPVDHNTIGYDQSNSAELLQVTSDSQRSKEAVGVLLTSPNQTQACLSFHKLGKVLRQSLTWISDQLSTRNESPSLHDHPSRIKLLDELKTERKESVTHVDQELFSEAVEEVVPSTPSARPAVNISVDSNHESLQENKTTTKNRQLRELFKKLTSSGIDDQIYRNAMFIMKNKFKSTSPKTACKIKSNISSTSEEYAKEYIPRKKKIEKVVKMVDTQIATEPNTEVPMEPNEPAISFKKPKMTDDQLQQERMIENALSILRKKTNKSPAVKHAILKKTASSTSDEYVRNMYNRCNDTTKEDLTERVNKLLKSMTKRT